MHISSEQCVQERHSFERRSRVPLPKLRAKEECYSFLSTGAMWEWHSFFKGGSGPLFPLFFSVFFLQDHELLGSFMFPNYLLTCLYVNRKFTIKTFLLMDKMPSENLTIPFFYLFFLKLYKLLKLQDNIIHSKRLIVLFSAKS